MRDTYVKITGKPRTWDYNRTVKVRNGSAGGWKKRGVSARLDLEDQRGGTCEQKGHGASRIRWDAAVACIHHTVCVKNNLWLSKAELSECEKSWYSHVCGDGWRMTHFTEKFSVWVKKLVSVSSSTSILHRPAVKTRSWLCLCSEWPNPVRTVHNEHLRDSTSFSRVQSNNRDLNYSYWLQLDLTILLSAQLQGRCFHLYNLKHTWMNTFLSAMKSLYLLVLISKC